MLESGTEIFCGHSKALRCGINQVRESSRGGARGSLLWILNPNGSANRIRQLHKVC
jgi:hypothetical protein